MSAGFGNSHAHAGPPSTVPPAATLQSQAGHGGVCPVPGGGLSPTFFSSLGSTLVTEQRDLRIFPSVQGATAGTAQRSCLLSWKIPVGPSLPHVWCVVKRILASSAQDDGLGLWSPGRQGLWSQVEKISGEPQALRSGGLALHGLQTPCTSLRVLLHFMAGVGPMALWLLQSVLVPKRCCSFYDKKTSQVCW